MDLDPTSAHTVYCECGAKYVVSGSHMDDSIECTMCGRRVRMKGGNSMRAGTPQRTALQAILDRHGDEVHAAQACDLVREHKYEEALNAYRTVLNGHPGLRDVFYGMGYCYSRLGDAPRGLALLRLAHECGHSTAIDLIRKMEPGFFRTVAQ